MCGRIHCRHNSVIGIRCFAAASRIARQSEMGTKMEICLRISSDMGVEFRVDRYG